MLKQDDAGMRLEIYFFLQVSSPGFIHPCRHLYTTVRIIAGYMQKCFYTEVRFYGFVSYGFEPCVDFITTLDTSSNAGHDAPKILVCMVLIACDDYSM